MPSFSGYPDTVAHSSVVFCLTLDLFLYEIERRRLLSLVGSDHAVPPYIERSIDDAIILLVLLSVSSNETQAPSLVSSDRCIDGYPTGFRRILKDFEGLGLSAR